MTNETKKAIKIIKSEKTNQKGRLCKIEFTDEAEYSLEIDFQGNKPTFCNWITGRRFSFSEAAARHWNKYIKNLANKALRDYYGKNTAWQI